MPFVRRAASRGTRSLRLLTAVYLFGFLLAEGQVSGVAAAASADLNWSALSSSTHPPALTGAAATYDGANGTDVIFGGRLANGALSSQTWVWNGSEWTSPSSGFSPEARTEASIAFDPTLDQVVLFGGRATNGDLLDDTWTWNGASWTETSISGDTPGAREGAAFSGTGQGQMVLYGGFGHSNHPQRPKPTPTTTTPKAKKKKKSGAGGRKHPAKTASPNTAKSPEARLLAASSTTPSVLGDTWVLEIQNDQDTWVPMSPSKVPPTLVGASLANQPNGTLVLFGGSTGPGVDSAGKSLSNQTWQYSGGTWTEESSKGAPPASRGSVMGYDTDLNAVVLVGGMAANGLLNDTWLWDGSSWSQAKPKSPLAPRQDATGADDPNGHQFLVFGGETAGGKYLDDTQILSTQAPTKIVAVPSTTASTTTPRSGASTGPTTTTAQDQNSATQLTRGRVVVLTGTGFRPKARITITFHSKSQVVGTAVADGNGAFTASVAVPPAAAYGLHHFIAAGRGPHGWRTLLTPVDVVAHVHHGLSRRDKLIMLAVAIALPVLAWFSISLLGRFRRKPPTS